MKIEGKWVILKDAVIKCDEIILIYFIRGCYRLYIYLKDRESPIAINCTDEDYKMLEEYLVKED